MNSFFILFFLYLCSLSQQVSNYNPIKQSNLYIKLGGEMFSVKLYDSPISGELLNLLPLRVDTLNKNEFISLLLSSEIEIEKEFSTVGKNSLIAAEKGDIVLFKRKELIMINKRVTLDNNNEYIKLGKIENIDDLYSSIKLNKQSIYLWNSFNYANFNENIKPHEHYINVMNYKTYKIVTLICYLYL